MQTQSNCRNNIIHCNNSFLKNRINKQCDNCKWAHWLTFSVRRCEWVNSEVKFATTTSCLREQWCSSQSQQFYQVNKKIETSKQHPRSTRLEQTHKLNGIKAILRDTESLLLSSLSHAHFNERSFHKDLTLEFRKFGNFSTSSSTCLRSTKSKPNIVVLKLSVIEYHLDVLSSGRVLPGFWETQFAKIFT